MKTTQTETMLDVESKQEATEVMEFMSKLTRAQRQEMLRFFQGANLAQSLAANTTAGA